MKRTSNWLAAAMCLAAAQTSFAEDLDWKLSTSFNYESGDFGTGVRTSSVYIPVTLKRYWDDWDASLTVPYVSRRGNAQTTNLGGRTVKIGKGRGPSATTTESGLGDVVLRGGYALMREAPGSFDLALVGKIKAPTADKDKGLGTGKFDEGLGLEFGKRVAPEWTLLADAYYTVIGDPAGLELRNQLALDLGFSHLLRSDLTLTVLLEGSNALVAGEPAPRDLRGIVDYKLSEQGSVMTGVLLGLSDGSPDYGFSLGAAYRF